MSSTVPFSLKPVPLAGCTRSSPLERRVQVGSLSPTGRLSSDSPEPAGHEHGPRRPSPSRAARPGSRPVIPWPRAAPPASAAPALCLRAHLSRDRMPLPQSLHALKRHRARSGPSGVAAAQARGAPRTMDGRGPPPHRAHWPQRTVPGNSAFPLANTDPAWRREGGWAEGIVGDVVLTSLLRPRARGQSLGGFDNLRRVHGTEAGKSTDWQSGPQTCDLGQITPLLYVLQIVVYKKGKLDGSSLSAVNCVADNFVRPFDSRKRPLNRKRICTEKSLPAQPGASPTAGPPARTWLLDTLLFTHVVFLGQEESFVPPLLPRTSHSFLRFLLYGTCLIIQP